MANNTVIQIKRSNTTATPSSLFQGELAWSNASQTIYVGNPDGSNTVTPIGTKLNYGTLAANAVLVTNSTSGINSIIVGNTVFSGASQSINVNGSTGTAGYVLVSNGTSNVYWANATTLTSVNTANAYTFTNVETFQANVVITSGNSTNQLLVGTIGLASNGVAITNNLIQVGNTSIYSNLSPSSLTTTTVLANVSGSYVSVSGQVNTATFYATTSANVGTYFIANSSGITSTGNTSLSGGVLLANSTVVNSSVYINSAGFTTTGNANAANFYSGANLVVNSTNIAWTGNTTTSPSISLSNTGALTIGNSSTTQTTSIITVANSVSNVQITPSTIAIGNTTTNTTVTNGLVQTTNGFYSVGQFNGTFTDGIVVDYVTNNGRISVGPGDSLTLYTGGVGTTSMAVVNTTGIYTGGVVNAAQYSVGSSFVVNSTVLSTSSNASFSGANVVISGTNTYISSNVTLGGSTITGTSTDLSIRNATVSGNLVVSGSVVSVNVQTLMVNDNIIELGDNNTSSDTVDTGWYSPAGNATAVWYSGMARIANKSSNTNPYFWIFGSNTNPNTATTIDSSSNSVTGTLQSYLTPYGTGGAFVANSTVVNITANSSLSSAIVANTLSLTTALAAAYGGTGQASYTTGDILYASGATALSKLSVTSNGQVLQITNNLPAYGGLDGGTF